MLELKNIVKCFDKGTPSETIAINHLNLQIKQGDFVTVIGGNGAGKSTLLNIIAGSVESDSGLILLNNNDISFMSEHKRAPYFGRVFQDPMSGTATDMSILENLTIAYGRGRPRSLFKWFIRKKEKEYLVEQIKTLDLGLEKRLGDKVGLLSGGQRQALTLLMATIRQRPTARVIKRDYVRFYDGDKDQAKRDIEIGFETAKKVRSDKLNNLKSLNITKEEKKSQIAAINAEFDENIAKFDVTKQILLLDEHTAALDPKTASKVLNITEKIVNENSLTTIMITHNMKDAIRYGNRLIMMSHGKVVVDVSGKEKQKLKVEDLLEMFQTASKDDFLSDSTILG